MSERPVIWFSLVIHLINYLSLRPTNVHAEVNVSHANSWLKR
ncbi:hypothetical protein [Nostoc sp. C110]